MNRQARHRKATEIRQAIFGMRNELKTATSSRKAELYSDIDVAMDDFETFTDDSLWEDDGSFSEGAEMGFDEPDFGSEYSEFDEYSDTPAYDDYAELDGAMYEYGDDLQFASDEVPLGAMDDHSNMYASENRAHVSYILDRTAEVVRSIENYEAAAKKAKKASRSSGARKAVASHMKALASVVASADFSRPSTGDALAKVGVGVMEMHKALKAS